MDTIKIRGAREHNLQNISLDLPRDKLIVITGVSGSGKSTLAFDTIYAEGQRRYVESLSAYARQFLGQMNKPDVDSIDGLSPAISIEQKTTSKNPRSTVGTVTEIYDYLRLLYARIGKPHCPTHGTPIEAQSPERIADTITYIAENGSEEDADEKGGRNGKYKKGAGKKKNAGTAENAGMTGTSGTTAPPADVTVTILSPIIRQKKGTYQQVLRDLNSQGYMRARVDGKIVRTDEEVTLQRYVKHDIDIVIDRLDPRDERSRLVEAIENALKNSNGLVTVIFDSEDAEGNRKSTEKIFSSQLSCPICGFSYEELQPRMFSFNSPFGACPECNGLGFKMDFDPDLIIPDKSLSLSENAVATYRNFLDGYRVQYLATVAKHHNFSIFTPIKDLTEEQYNVLMYGSDQVIRFNMSMKGGEVEWSHNGVWEGLLPQAIRLYSQTKSEYRKKELEKFMRISECQSCKGKRLSPKALAVTIADKSIIDVTEMSISDCIKFFNGLKLSEKDAEIARLILREITSRLRFLEEVGLGYLTLSRSSGTLSGGEAQRIRLATQIGSNLMGVLYVLDEPSIGLHQRDNHKLIETLQKLKNLGNTLIVVEHDEDTIREADFVVDIGPGAGVNGGRVAAIGTPKEIEGFKDSLTGMYLSGAEKIDLPATRRKSESFIHMKGCRKNNLKSIDVDIPTGVLTVITGVSGSGKSTLVYDTLYNGLMKEINRSKTDTYCDSIAFDEKPDKVIVIDQSPIGRTPRSNPATYTKVFDDIRAIFAETKEAKIRGYNAGRFSFNVKGGRCEACSGDGLIKIEMNFLPDVYVECEECKGKRYNAETLEVKFKGKSIADVLDMTAAEALELFENHPNARAKLDTLCKVGLGYLKLGQSSTTLSGGEAQRIKLTKELSKRATGKTVYILDEPTTGLHFHDVKKLISILEALVDKGNSVIVIEHNLDVIKCADYIIDLGPEGGDKGGEIVTTGTPEEVAKCRKSYTGQFLAPLLKKKR